MGRQEGNQPPRIRPTTRRGHLLDMWQTRSHHHRPHQTQVHAPPTHVGADEPQSSTRPGYRYVSRTVRTRKHTHPHTRKKHQRNQRHHRPTLRRQKHLRETARQAIASSPRPRRNRQSTRITRHTHSTRPTCSSSTTREEHHHRPRAQHTTQDGRLDHHNQPHPHPARRIQTRQRHDHTHRPRH